MEILFVLLLIILNGAFAMAEIAIISLRKHKLQQKAQDGDERAIKALELAENPNRFLSTVQFGITLVGIFAGAFGGATIAAGVSKGLKTIPLIAPYSDGVALTLVVIVITYLSLIIGELVPKRIALSNPEAIALIVARPMNWVSKLAVPFVNLLSSSTDAILKLLRIKPNAEPNVTEEDIRILIREGTEVGVFEIAEKNIVDRTFRLSDKKVNSLMTPRKHIVWLDIDSSFKTIRNKISKNTHVYYPVCKNSLDTVIGVIRTERLLTNFLIDEKMDIEKSLHKPLFIPSSTPALKVLELFKKSGIHLALIVDEYGMVEGVITITDILEAIVGDIPLATDTEEKNIIRRDKKSWFVNGITPIDEFKEYFHFRKLPGEKSGNFLTVAGYVISKFGQIPKTGETFDHDKFIFEIVDMDGNRVDKVLVTQKGK